MTTVNNYHKNTLWLARLAGLFSFVFVSLILLTLIDSLYQEPPFIEVSSEAKVIDGINHKMLQINRKFKRQNDNVATLQGELISEENKYSLHLPDNTIEHSMDFYELVLIPNDFEGKWCIDSEIRFSYRMSVRMHVMDLADVCIDIPKFNRELRIDKELR